MELRGSISKEIREKDVGEFYSKIEFYAGVIAENENEAKALNEHYNTINYLIKERTFEAFGDIDADVYTELWKDEKGLIERGKLREVYLSGEFTDSNVRMTEEELKKTLKHFMSIVQNSTIDGIRRDMEHTVELSVKFELPL